MIRICLLCLPLLLAAGAAYAQLYPSKVTRMDTGKVYLRLQPIGLADLLDGNFTVGGEYRFNKTWSATLDAGFIFYSKYMGYTEKTTGILLRPGIRKYAGKYKDYFFDLQLHYKEVMYRVYDWIDRGVVNGAPAYQELTTFRYRKQVYGVHLMAGGREFLTKDHRLFLEIVAGIGIHYKVTGAYHEGNSLVEDPFALVINRNNNLKTPARTVMPALPLTVRVVYKLR
ncbi:hypothetical protein A3860_24710 [Niastella vici]|uniref:DUF3575 domain-containing protein n=1 Tax=Niastella vici TaxID=1703345 RepID=A0A1V9FYV0_9BACT|nr:hypothetical protein [Niastella vici]OQP63545.1 hypothetical protein A3860_24710 [Niastella vici]